MAPETSTPDSPARTETTSPKPPLRHRLIRLFWPWYCVFSAEDMERYTRTGAEATRKEKEALASISTWEEDAIREALSRYRDLHDREESRKTGADSRLTTIVGLSSITMSIATPAMLAAIQKSSLKDTGSFLLSLVLAAIAIYVMTQLLFSVRAATNGLSVRLYSEVDLADEILERKDETRSACMIRAIPAYRKTIENHEQNNSDKLKQLQAAYQALRNFLAGAVALGILVMLQKMLGTTGTNGG